MSESNARPWLRTLLAFALGLAAAAGAGLVLLQGDGSAPDPAAPETAASAAEPAGTAVPSDRGSAATAPAPPETSDPALAPADTPQDKPLAPFATLELSRASFPKSGPVVVKLDLVEPSADDKPRPVRMFSFTDHRGIIADARLDASRSVAILDIPADFLQPGHYFVEVKTTEISAFPVRRYALVVR